MKKLLCVGGYFDGERFEVDDRSFFVVLQKPMSVLTLSDHLGPVSTEAIVESLEDQRYHVWQLFGHEMLVYELVMPKEALGKLIEGYNAKGE